MARPKKIIYDKELTKTNEAKPIAKGLGSKVEVFFFTLDKMPAGAKWVLTLFIGGILSTLVSLAVAIYFDIELFSMTEVNVFFRVQFIFDVIIIVILGIFIGLLVRESRKAR